jgi:hypothetical protein
MPITAINHFVMGNLKTLSAKAQRALLLICVFALFGCDTQPVTASQQSLVSISDVDCVSEDVARAIVSGDGKSLAIQCGDKTVKIWTQGSRELMSRKSAPLFLAARQASIIPSNWHCPRLEMHQNPLAFDIRFSDANDCDVVDHTDDNVSYIVKGTDIPTAYVVTPLGKESNEPNVYTAGILDSLSAKSLGLDYYPQPKPILDGDGAEVRESRSRGIFLPRHSAPTEIVVPTLDGHGLEALALDGHGIRKVSTFRMPTGLPWEDTDSRADSLSYSSTYKLLIVQCNGIFRFFRGDMTYVRAYSLDGTEQWTIRKPTQDTGGYAMGSAHVLLFGDGRFAAVGYWNRAKDVVSKPTFDIVNIKDGAVLGTFDGWPIATSALANRVMVATMSKGFELVDYTPLIHQFDEKGIVKNVIRRFETRIY